MAAEEKTAQMHRTCLTQSAFHFQGHHACLWSSRISVPSITPFINTQCGYFNLVSLVVTNTPLKTSQRPRILQVDVESPTNSTLPLIHFSLLWQNSGIRERVRLKERENEAHSPSQRVVFFAPDFLYSFSFQPALSNLQLSHLITKSNLWVICLITANIRKGVGFHQKEERNLYF